MNRTIFFIYFILQFSVSVSEKLAWRNLSRKTFTKQHNQEMLDAYSQDPEYAKIISKIKNTTRSITMEETIFMLYTRRAPDGVRVFVDDDSLLEKADFNPDRETFFLTHGFLSGADAGWVTRMMQRQILVSDCNFFTIDWGACAQTLSYPDAIDCLPKVGNFTARVIKFIHSKGVDLLKIHLLGHSLGAHLMAQVSLYGIKVGRITGLDPAGPLFSEDDTNSRIDPGDAERVDIIHTSRGAFGYEDPTGRWDFYPNGGYLQPGCFQPVCDHSKAHMFYTDSILNTHIYPSFKCDSLESAFGGNCRGLKYYMGVLGTQGPGGIYYCYLSPAAFAWAKVGLLAFALVFLIISLITVSVMLIKNIEVNLFVPFRQKREIFYERSY